MSVRQPTKYQPLNLIDLLKLKVGDKFVVTIREYDEDGEVNAVKTEYQEVTIQKIFHYKHNNSTELVDSIGRSHIIIPDEDFMEDNQAFGDLSDWSYYQPLPKENATPKCTCSLNVVMNQGCRCGGR